MMNKSQAKAVYDLIKNYIDRFDGDDIDKYSLEKVCNLYKIFIDTTLNKVSKSSQYEGEVKKEVSIIKKIKILTKKSIPVGGRIKSYKEKAEKITSIFERHDIFYDLLLSYKHLNELERKIDREWDKYEKWFDWLVDNGEGSYLATHVAKLTHSSSKGSSIDSRFFSSCSKYNEYYLNSKGSGFVDSAYPNNKFSSISKLYAIKCEYGYIGDLLRNNPEEYLRGFFKDKELYRSCCEKMSSYIKEERKKSYFLNKQTYFPVGEASYHLLLPLKSSSLIHELHLEHKKYFDEGQIKAREQRKKKQYSPINVRAYPNKAYLHVTGSNHSNASALNGQRAGRIALFSAMPPQWQSTIKSVKTRDSIFDRDLGRYLKDDIRELKKYLLVIKKEALSIGKPERNAVVVKKLWIINESFFSYVQLCKSGEQALGWTISSNLPIEQQLLFEPEREDDKAVSIKMDRVWMKSLASSYGRWLNNQLKDKQLTLTPIHSELWGRHFLQDLREYIAIQEAEL